MSLWLPPSYEGGDVQQDLNLITQRMRALGPQFETMARTLEQNPSAFVFFAVDSQMDSSEVLSNVTIGKEQILSTMTLSMYLDLVYQQLAGIFTILERDQIMLNGKQGGKFITQISFGEQSIKQLIYLIQDQNMIWILTFTTSENEFDSKLPTLEQVANTFEVSL